MAILVFTHLNKTVLLPHSPISVDGLKQHADSVTGDEENLYYTYNGKRIGISDVITGGVVHAVPRMVGGKGGFGSMLRAIGAQIEKTTNREACRDLSGRRLRDINEEKRLKNWIAQQADREREVAEKRKKKLERLCAEPKHEFQDKDYERQRSDLTEKVWSAVDQGIKASTSGCSGPSSSTKRKLPEPKNKAKKSCLWVAEFDDLSSCSSDDSEEENGSTEGPSSNGRTKTDKVDEAKGIDGKIGREDKSGNTKNSVDSSVCFEEPAKVRQNGFGIEEKNLGNDTKENQSVTCTSPDDLSVQPVSGLEGDGNASISANG